MAESISVKRKRNLNKANMRLLLSALDPKRKDIVVTKKHGRYDSDPKEWHVKNAKGQEIFSFKRESVEHEDGLYNVVYSHLLTLKINGISISVDTEYYGGEWDTMVFLDKELKEALDTKLYAQKEEQQLQNALKKMSVQDRIIKSYLENTLQK